MKIHLHQKLVYVFISCCMVIFWAVGCQPSKESEATDQAKHESQASSDTPDSNQKKSSDNVTFSKSELESVRVAFDTYLSTEEAIEFLKKDPVSHGMNMDHLINKAMEESEIDPDKMLAYKTMLRTTNPYSLAPDQSSLLITLLEVLDTHLQKHGVRKTYRGLSLQPMDSIPEFSSEDIETFIQQLDTFFQTEEGQSLLQSNPAKNVTLHQFGSLMASIIGEVAEKANLSPLPFVQYFVHLDTITPEHQTLRQQFKEKVNDHLRLKELPLF